ncbi:hypothetical protein GCM10007276_30780 [Agaricicola taiwanensis]|uniref:Ankyrin repeat domain-containing protein n=1 Tax=Agaricicola taiwanensis TaxID=591372 RepID=A0A8J3DXH5_9RHOB|nr:hypothetical protein [Agaricicola taiwanensis]GGE51586.1 hypothetical protein GCM10007276_30780 [Agaricicola taiwanensis]
MRVAVAGHEASSLPSGETTDDLTFADAWQKVQDLSGRRGPGATTGVTNGKSWESRSARADEATQELRVLVKELLSAPSTVDPSEIRRRIRELAEKGADLNAGLDGKAPEEDTGLLQAAALLEDPALFEALLETAPVKERQALLNKTWRDGNTVMHALGIRGDKALFDKAVVMGGDPKVENAKGVTPEHLLAEHKKRGLPLIAAVSLGGSLTPAGWVVLAGIGVALLVAHFMAAKNAKGTSPAVKPFEGTVADDQLGAALVMGDEAAALAALEAGADPAKGYSADISFLLFASATGQDKVARAMVKRLAAKGQAATVLNTPGVNGMTPALAAAFDGNRALVEHFKAQGADLTIKETLFGLTAEEALAEAGDTQKRSTDDVPYRPGRGRFRNWIRRVVGRLSNPPTRTQPPPPGYSPPETGNGGVPSGQLQVVEPDPNGEVLWGWDEDNSDDRLRLRNRAQALTNQLNDILGTDYRMTDNFDDGDILQVTIGNRMIGSPPTARAVPGGGAQPEYILTVLADLVNIAQGTSTWRDNIRQFLADPRSGGAIRNLMSNTNSDRYNKGGNIIYNPYVDKNLSKSHRPFMILAHEIHHFLADDPDTDRLDYGLPRGEFDGQTGLIDGVPVVWRQRPGSTGWYIPLFGNDSTMEVPYVEARATGIGPFADTNLFPDTENALAVAYGATPRSTYFTNPGELSEQPSSQHPNGVWGDADRPWNQPDWVPPPVRPTGVTNLSHRSAPRSTLPPPDIGRHPLAQAKEEDYRRLLNIIGVTLEGEAGLDSSERTPLTAPPLSTAFRDLVTYNLIHQDEIEGLARGSLAYLELARDKALNDIIEFLPEKGHEGSEPRRAFQDYLDKEGRSHADEVAKAAWSDYLAFLDTMGKPASPAASSIDAGYKLVESEEDYYNLLSGDPGVVTYFSSDDEFSGIIRFHQEKDGKVFNKGVIDRQAHPDLADRARDERDLMDRVKRGEFDFASLFELRFGRASGQPEWSPAAKRVMDDWLSAAKPSEEEQRKIWSDLTHSNYATMKEIRDSGVTNNHVLIHQFIMAFFYDKAHVPNEQEYENALNALAVYIATSMQKERRLPVIEGEAREHLNTVIRYYHHNLKPRDEDKEFGLRALRYHLGDDYLFEDIPGIVGERVENVFGPGLEGALASNVVARWLSDKESDSYAVMKELIVEEHKKYTAFCNVYFGGPNDPRLAPPR